MVHACVRIHIIPSYAQITILSPYVRTELQLPKRAGHLREEGVHDVHLLQEDVLVRALWERSRWGGGGRSGSAHTHIPFSLPLVPTTRSTTTHNLSVQAAHDVLGVETPLPEALQDVSTRLLRHLFSGGICCVGRWVGGISWDRRVHHDTLPRLICLPAAARAARPPSHRHRQRCRWPRTRAAGGRARRGRGTRPAACGSRSRRWDAACGGGNITIC